jgi:CBS domain containing-hemolysin-like protein
MPTKGEVFVQEFVLGFGFLGGLFAWVGSDPEEEDLRALIRAFLTNNELMISAVIFGFVLISTVVSILGTLAMGGKFGLLVVAIAWIAGFTIPMGGSLSILGAILLIVALILGPVAYEHRFE